MQKPYPYEVLRPSFEAYLSLICVIYASILLYGLQQSYLPNVWVLWCLVLMGLGLFLWNAYRFFFRQKILDRWRFRPLRKISVHTLLAKNTTVQDENWTPEAGFGRIFLGMATTWDTQCAQGVKIAQLRASDQLKLSAHHYLWPHPNSLSPLSLPIDCFKGHSLVLGSTGSGKTRLLEILLSQILSQKPKSSIWILDPKGDSDLKQTLEGVCTLNQTATRLKSLDLSRPSLSIRYDPIRSFTRQTQIASRLSAGMSQSAQAKTFSDFAWQVVYILSRALIQMQEAANLSQINKVLNQGLGPLLERYFSFQEQKYSQVSMSTQTLKDRHSAYMRFLAQIEQGDEVLESLWRLFNHPADHFQKMIASLLPVLQKLSSDDLGLLFNENVFDAQDRPVFDSHSLIRTQSVVYIGLDALGDSNIALQVGRMVLADLAACAAQRYTLSSFEQTQLETLYIVVDEASELMCEPLIQLLNKGRGAHVEVIILTQTISDFEAALSSMAKARQILANCNQLFSFRVLDAPSQSYVVERMGIAYLNDQSVAVNSHDELDSYQAGSSGFSVAEQHLTEMLLASTSLAKLPNLCGFYVAKEEACHYFELALLQDVKL